jgi:hypothetical protein
MLATGEKTPTPARRAAPSSSEPSPSTKKARGDVAPVLGVGVGAGVGLVEMPEGGSPCGGGTRTVTGTGMARVVGGAEVSMLAILDSDLGDN